MHKKIVTINWELTSGLIFIILLVSKVFVRFEPLDYFPNDDSAVFLYVGRGILNGRIPYLDVWDHKGPFLYFINAFGLWFFGLWGVWALEFIFIFIGLYIAFINGRKLFGAAPALLGILAGYYLLDLFMAGNITEEYSSAFALISYGLYFLYLQKKLPKLSLFGIGFLFMCTFFVRPNNIGFQAATILSIGVMHIIQKDTTNLKVMIIWVGLGMMTLLFPFLFYFGFNHALGEFYDQAFRYNLVYVNASKSSVNFTKFLYPPFRPLTFIAIASYGVILIDTRKIKDKIQSPKNGLSLLLLFAFPLELVLSNISGRGYNHYYITWMPYLITATSFFTGKILRGFLTTTNINKALFFLTILVYLTSQPLLPTLFQYAKIGKYFIYNRANGVEKNNSLIDYIHDNTDANDKVLRWGFGRWLTYEIEREAPGRYLYQFELATPGYTTDEMVNEFANDIKQDKPKFIIEAINYFIPLDLYEISSYSGYIHSEYYNIIKFIRNNYSVVKLNFYFDGHNKEDKWIRVWKLNTP